MGDHAEMGGARGCRHHLAGDGPAFRLIAGEQRLGVTPPASTAAIFQERFTASWMPVFIPCPPAGLWM